MTDPEPPSEAPIADLKEPKDGGLQPKDWARYRGAVVARANYQADRQRQNDDNVKQLVLKQAALQRDLNLLQMEISVARTNKDKEFDAGHLELDQKIQSLHGEFARTYAVPFFPFELDDAGKFVRPKAPPPPPGTPPQR